MEPTLVVKNLSKRYGTVQALREVSVAFYPGEIHALLGENGAGKSSLVGAIAGFVLPDSGAIELAGQDSYPYGQPFKVKHLSIEMVHQHFMLVPAFTVEQNIAMGLVESLSSTLNIAEASQPGLKIAAELGWRIDPKAKIDQLPVGAQQRVEILKALAVLKANGKPQGSVLILDEPTAVLSPDEVDDLFRVLRELKVEGYSIVLIAHKLREVMSVADRVTVLRRGEFVATSMISETNAEQLATWMVGQVPPLTRPPSATLGETVVSGNKVYVHGDRGEIAIRTVVFLIRKHEILGFGGVDGNGQVELAEALAGIRKSSGIQNSARAIAYIPQDRRLDGLALPMTILDNLMVRGHEQSKLRTGLFISPAKARLWATQLVEKFQVKIGSLDDPVRSLSGGNQQKIVVARTLDEQPDLVVAVNPTRGLDVQATEFVHRQLVACAEAGAAVALFSSDLEELASLATRIVMLSGGELREEFSAQALGGVIP